MLDQKELNFLKRGDPVDHFLIVRKSEVRLTKNNKQYLSMDLGDQTQTLNANMWDNFEEISLNIKSGTIVKVSGSIDEFQGSPQIRITSVRLTSPKENVSPGDFLAHSKRDLTEMKNEFLSRMNRIGDPNDFYR